MSANGTGKLHRLGTHRVVSPEETCERALRLMPKMGATRVANVTGLDVVGIPVVTVSRPASRSICVSQGKGLSLAAAKASALMEALELHSAERPQAALTRASARELRERGARIAWDGLPEPSGARKDPHTPILWARGREPLNNESEVWVPLSVVHTDWTYPLSADAGWFFGSSNGLASGNHLLEAMSHAICEVVERDAKTLWHHLSDARREATRVALTTVNDESSLDLIERFRRAGLGVAVWDLTSDVGLATFMCVIGDDTARELRPMPTFAGEGCHPAREVALLRALTEAAQSRLTFIVGSRDDVGRSEYARRLDPQFNLRNAARVRPSEGSRSFLEVPTYDGLTFEADLAWELERLRSAGFSRVYAVDLTTEELGVPVVRVVIPELEGAHEVPGYTPGPSLGARVA